MKKGTQRLSQLLTAMALAGVASYSMAADTIKIALAGPVTGAVAQYGEMQFIGAKMAIEQINKAGGVDGKQLEGVVYDDACDPKQAVAVANKIVNDGVKFVVGHLCSSSTQPASDIYEDEGILMITAASTSPDITSRGYKLIFRTIGLDSLQGPTAGKFIAEHVKPKSVAVIHDKQQYGEGIATAVKKTLEDSGIKVPLFEGINAGDKDFSAMIAKLKQSGVDFVYYGGYHPELGLILRQAAEKGLKVGFMGPEGVGNKELSAIAGGASEGLYVTLPKSFDQDPKNQPLVDAFKAKNEDPSGPFVFPAYAAVQVIADGIKKAGSDDTEKVAEALRSNTFSTPTGDLAFDEKGDLKNFNFVVYQWHKDGTKTEAK
ncbi:branched-chain amino acid ABC transporter substrate-binding protein [Pseudomonas schmalbachii]|uniref:Branched-chain amino acid ABC transporter substrate-binding protein n=1 Tax=Pseudomonas schmalbachii TaxID=2816993 RepID=A0ABS3TRU4_9PSED|nr:branched-chain amino acid ABC transporter substrate-binding protein [Pseudomonas schmalbachii]MBO3276392.1 branched-chain amino acid ABC transporter substrate-binding protein [Pseudomonas schmalbachii]